jgi:predicted RNase H-like HicB family nuclease
MSCSYTVILEPDPAGGFHVFCPGLKGCHSEGETEAEALSNIQEAIELYVETLVEDGMPLPSDVQAKSVTIAV